MTAFEHPVPAEAALIVALPGQGIEPGPVVLNFQVNGDRTDPPISCGAAPFIEVSFDVRGAVLLRTKLLPEPEHRAVHGQFMSQTMTAPGCGYGFDEGRGAELRGHGDQQDQEQDQEQEHGQQGKTSALHSAFWGMGCSFSAHETR